ncbi:MAG TPA: hypothetical protein VFF20_09135 [Pseudogracilibacillus sp.]|nr:hypothetical protein [Pseudogracilibacillus sp.]
MRNILFALAAMTLLLAACNSGPNEEKIENEAVKTNEVEETEIEPEEEVEEEKAAETAKETSVEEKEDEPDKSQAEEVDKPADKGQANKKDEGKKDTNKPSANDKAETKPAKEDAGEKPTKIDNMKHLDIVHLAYDVLAAQDKRDYAYLESVAAKGTKLDRKANKFHFENASSPFDMDFYTKETGDNLEVRYTHEEDGKVTVGIAVTNYETESSFVYVFEFVKESSKWKLVSMDLDA